MADNNEVEAIMVMVSAAYPAINVSSATMDVYRRHLEDVPPGELMAGAEQHMKASRFFPTIAELRTVFDKRVADGKRIEKADAWKAQLEEHSRHTMPKAEAKQLLSNVLQMAGGRKILPRGGQ